MEWLFWVGAWYGVGVAASVALTAHDWFRGRNIKYSDIAGAVAMTALGPVLWIIFVIHVIDDFDGHMKRVAIRGRRA